jgi:glycosyltransferase involved in cell wall biosynthesis
MPSGSMKWGVLRSAEAFILPSHQENFGTAVTEALAAGTPVLISNKVNIGPEIEDDGEELFPTIRRKASVNCCDRSLVARNGTDALRTATYSSFEHHFEIGKAGENLGSVLVKAIGVN